MKRAKKVIYKKNSTEMNRKEYIENYYDSRKRVFYDWLYVQDPDNEIFAEFEQWQLTQDLEGHTNIMPKPITNIIQNTILPTPVLPKGLWQKLVEHCIEKHKIAKHYNKGLCWWIEEVFADRLTVDIEIS